MAAMMPVVGSTLFFAAAPGVVAGLVPYLLTGWRVERAAPGFGAIRLLGAGLVVAGVICLIDCFARFAIQGRGTPAPVAPTEQLVASGFYRHVRNPMYVAVVGIILGQSLVLGSLTLLGYAGVVWLLFHLFVLAYEEPTLRRQFGDAYVRYTSAVRRWWPRWRPWKGQA